MTLLEGHSCSSDTDSAIDSFQVTKVCAARFYIYCLTTYLIFLTLTNKWLNNMDFNELMVHGFEYLISAWCHPNDIYHFNDFYPCYLRYFIRIWYFIYGTWAVLYYKRSQVMVWLTLGLVQCSRWRNMEKGQKPTIAAYGIAMAGTPFNNYLWRLSKICHTILPFNNTACVFRNS